MSTPTCQHCGKNWTYKETFKLSFSLNTGMFCNYCNRKQYPTAKSRKAYSILGLFPICSLILVMLNVSMTIVFSALFGSGIIVILIYPFIVSLSNKEEPYPF